MKTFYKAIHSKMYKREINLKKKIRLNSLEKILILFLFFIRYWILKNVYIIGAGLSGLSASTHGVVKNFNIKLFESSNLVGGRCRSFFEKKLGIEIDNGNHLVFSANKNFYDLCKLIQTTDKIKTFEPNLFFFDKLNNKSWEISLSLFDLIFNL